MHKIWQFFVRKNRFSYLLMVALAGFGLLSIVLIPKESSPEVQIPVGIVTTVLPGAPAADVESLVTNEIERKLEGALNDVNTITSSSREGVSSVIVEFDASADIDKSIADLKDEIDTIQPELPSDAEDSFVSEIAFVDQPIMLIAISADFSDVEFTALMNSLEREIESLPSISRVETSGVRDREVTVIVDQSALAKFSLTLSEVISGVQRANITFPVGQIETDGIKYNVAFEGDLIDTSEVLDIALTTRGGQPVFVRDVAEVRDDLDEVVTLSRLSVLGEPSKNAVSLQVFKQRGGDITKIARSVNNRLEELQQPGGILEGVEVLTIIDSGKDIREDLVRLSSSGLTTVALVILVLVLAIGWREGLVAGSAIPLSFVIGFIGLNISGNTINFVSLFSLILAVGILVDSAIVMVEGINRRMKDDPEIDKRQAALDTIEEFSIPLLAGTLTTVAMFSGLFLVGGVTGDFIASIPFTINFILFASLLVALGFIPLIASNVLRRRSKTTFEQKQVAYSRRLENWYRRKLKTILGNRKKEQKFLWGIRGLLVIAILLPILGFVKVVFFEQSDIDYIYAQVELPQGSAREESDIASRRIEEILYQNDQIGSFLTTVGEPSLFGTGGAADEKYASFLITLREDRDQTSTEVVSDLRKEFIKLRDLNTLVDQPSDGPPTGADLGFRFLGDDLVELSSIADQSAEILKRIPNTTNVTVSTNNNSTEYVLTLEREKAAALGLNPFVISQMLRSAVFGTDATSLTTLDQDIDVVVKVNLANQESFSTNETNKATIDDLLNMEIITPSGEAVLLSSLVDVSLRESSSVINHDDGKRVISISASISGERNVKEINSLFLDELDRAGLIPDDVKIEVGGETEESDQAFFEMFLALILGVVLMLAVLVLQFNSYRHTRYVLSILPYSLIGILFGLFVTQLPLSFPSLMGFVALSGIVVNNSILLIDMMNKNRVNYPDRTVTENVIDASVSRLRPILLTTSTTVIGMLPLTYASDLWSPLAFAIMFGLSFSVIITLLLIPIIYNRNPGELGAVLKQAR